MSENQITLWQNGGAVCPFSQRPMIALAEKGIPYTLKQATCRADLPVDSELAELYRSIHPDPTSAAKVPILQHHRPEGTLNIIESAPCAEYIEGAFPDHGTKLRPDSPQERNAIRMFLEFAGPWNPFGVLIQSRENIEKSLQDFAKASINLNAALEKWSLPGGDFLLGDRFSMAEVLTGSLAIRMEEWKSDRDINVLNLLEGLGCGRLARWYTAVTSRRSIRETYNLLDRENRIAYFGFRGTQWLKIKCEVRDGTIALISAEEYDPNVGMPA